MSLLVMSDCVFLLYLGWELIGLTSFLLINFWTTRRGTMKSAFKAFIFNKLSDIFILLPFIYISINSGTTSLSVWGSLNSMQLFDYAHINICAFSLFLGCCIKSAQIIGHLWLPDSMEAPIPASALIHSATLVSAGIYILLRVRYLLEAADLISVMMYVGSITACYGGVVSAAQSDAKKLLAYSTVSHCGFLFVCVSLGDISVIITYLYLHGFFKALTFFCVGNIVKFARGNQDIRSMGHFFIFLPAESVLLVICAFNLGGMPFTMGFYYKHFLQAVSVFCGNHSLVAGFILIGMLSSVVYVYKLIYYIFFDIRKGNKAIYKQATNPSLNTKYYSNSSFFSILCIVVTLIFVTIFFELILTRLS